MEHNREDISVEFGRVIGRGRFGKVYSGIITETGRDCAVKVLYDQDNFEEEKQQYILASELGFGAEYYGTTLSGDFKGIVMEKIDNRFSPKDRETIQPFLRLLYRIAQAGYFSGDFHCNNIMVDRQGEARLIDPSLVSTKSFISEQVSRGRLGEEYLNFPDTELADFALGFMIDYITHPYFGGIPLSSHPEYNEKFLEFMCGRNTLHFLFNTGGWKYKEWEPLFPANR